MSKNNSENLDTAGAKGEENLGAELFDEKIDSPPPLETASNALEEEFQIMAPQNMSSAAETKFAVGENRRMIRNVIFIGLAFTLLFTAYKGMANLQSSIHDKGGLGNWASAVTYVSLILSALFVPTALIQKTGVKWAIFISIFGYLIFILAQFYPHFLTLLPSAAIVGFCAAPLWAAKCSYLTQMGTHYARHMSQPAETAIVRFFGLFFMTYQTNGLFGNLISSIVLSSSLFSTANDETVASATVDDEEAEKIKIISGRLFCGANFCPASFSSVSSSSNSSASIPIQEETRDMTRIQILAGIYVAITCLAAALLAFMVDSLHRYGETRREGTTRKLLVATFRQMRNSNQILLIPLTMWTGLQLGFLSADYTAAYITCGWGVEKVGFVLICFGLANSFASMIYSHVVRWAGRVFMFFFAATLSIGLICGLLVWEPSSENSYYFFVFSALWGVIDACWQCGLNAYYGVLFHDNSEAAFSTYRVWESVGYVIAFVVSNLICVRAKLFLILTVLVVGMAGFSVIEIGERRRRMKNQDIEK